MVVMYHVYVLQSAKTGRFYVGSTGNIEDRIRDHNSGLSKATRHGIPWHLIHKEEFPTRAEAARRERYYKTGKGREELKGQLASSTPLLLPKDIVWSASGHLEIT